MALPQQAPDRDLWGELRALIDDIPHTSPKDLATIYLRFSAEERSFRVKPYLQTKLSSRWTSWQSSWPNEANWQFTTLARWIWDGHDAP